MVKKIIISYTNNPEVDDAFGFAFFLDGLAIPLNNFLGVNVTYWQIGGNSNPFGIGIKPTLGETIDNTVSFLQGQYHNPNLIYVRVNNTIEITMNIDGVTATTSILSDNYTITQSDVEPNEDVNLKYYFEYDSVNGDRYLCKINKKEFNGNAIEIHGKATITKGSVKEHLDTFRGTGLDIELEATNELTLSDLYTDDEQTYTVRFYKNNKLIFRGFLKPDGVFESFVEDRWLLNLECIDGLGTLENLSFVKENGLFFTGRLKAIDIIYNCLKRIGIPMKFNTSINIYYDGLTPMDNLDPFATVYLSVDRFIKTDNITIMSCEEVLTSVLDIFGCVITQKDGEWFIYNPNELYFNTYPKFRKYTQLGVFERVVTVNLNAVLGSQIDNFYPHHCSANQRKEIKGAVSAFRLGYKYGKISGLLPNPNFYYSGNLVAPYSDWILNLPAASGSIIFDPTNQSGLITRISNRDETQLFLAENTGVPLVQDFEYVLRSNISVASFPTIFKTSYLIYKWAVVLNNQYYLDINGNWVTTPTQIEFQFAIDANENGWTPEISFDFSTKTAKLPISGNAVIELYSVKFLDEKFVGDFRPVVEFNIVDFLPANTETLQGEFHTVQRKTKPSSLIKANKTVYNGDRTSKEYIGDIFKQDKVTTTSLWNRKNTYEQFPLLRIVAENALRIAQKPLLVFIGDVYGELPYLSVISINNIQGKFMPIEWEFDTVRNVGKVKLLELYAEEINDIDYELTFDYGNTVKPTIKG